MKSNFHPLHLVGTCIFCICVFAFLFGHFKTLALLGQCLGMALIVIGIRSNKRKAPSIVSPSRRRMRRNIILLSGMAIIALPLSALLFPIIPAFATLPPARYAFAFRVYLICYILSWSGIIAWLYFKMRKLPKEEAEVSP